MEEKTHIANPLYDVVFRYMMEDNKVAKLFLSAIIGEQIEELIFSPTTHSTKIGEEGSITVIRMDFSARIKQEDGEEKLIIIELQKAKFYHQTMRFRRYLGKQYGNPENVKRATIDSDKKEALPIYPIYILGEAFSKKKMPVIKVQREYIDVGTNKVIEEKHPFIEALTHDAIVVQIPHLKGSRRTILEQFLSIFDQSQQIDKKGHILALKEEDYPEKYRKVIRRLNKALQSPKIEEDMNVEDEVIEELNKKDEEIARARKVMMEARQRAEAESQRAEAESQRAEAESQRAEAAHQSNQLLIQHLHQLGQTPDAIAQISGISEAEVKEILGL
ncbi:MAG: hypothetical protein AAF806_00860 [Bacteroidota bacterium]